MPYWDHKGENARSVFTMDRAFLFYVPPPDCPKSAFSEVVESGVL